MGGIGPTHDKGQADIDDSEQRFGAEKSRVILAKNGIRVGKKRISAIMQELGLSIADQRTNKSFRKG